VQIGGSDATSRMRMFGLGSGLEVDDTVRRLMAAERIPLDRLLQQRQLLGWRKADLRSANTRLKELSEAALPMRLSATFSARSATSSNPAVATATAQVAAPTGAYSLVVDRLAEAVHLGSGGKITKAGGSTATLAEQFDLESLGFSLSDPDARVEFRISNAAANGGEGITFSFDPHTDSIYTVAQSINSSGLGLQAFYDAELDRFFLSSKQTGESTSIVFAAADPELGYPAPGIFLSMVQLKRGAEDVFAGTGYTGVNAGFTLNGMALEQESNDFTINGVSYALKAAAPGMLVTVRVAHDVDAAVDDIKAFIDKYNDVIKSINDKLAERRYYDYPPLTSAQKEGMSEKEIAQWEEKARSGSLRNDPLLRQALTRLRSALTAPVQGTGSSKYTMLAGIGIDTGSWYEQGKLYIKDEARLRKALAEEPEAVAALFAQSGDASETQGVGRRLAAVLAGVTKQLGEYAGDVDVVHDESLLGRQIKRLDAGVESWEARLVRREEAYYRQYSVLESYIAQMGAQASWFAQQFSSGA
jgi:flagellar hook-associated protein 2